MTQSPTPAGQETPLSDKFLHSAGLESVDNTRKDRPDISKFVRQLELALRAAEQAEARAAAAERDAGRYRWLRRYEWDLIILPKFVGNPSLDNYEYANSPGELDAAIDAQEGKK